MTESILAIKKNDNLPIKHQISDAFDKFGFFCAFLTGLIGIVLLKALHFSQFLVTTVPVTVMLTYASLIYLSQRARLGEDQSGDNLYYLGFLYTLISLSFALYQFDGNGGTAIIIENFGIALASTIVGLFLRIIFNQMRHDPVEIEREARLELASAASRLRVNLLEVTQIMKSTLIAAQQQTSEIMQNYGERFDNIAETIFAKTDEAHKTLLDNTIRLNKCTDKFLKGLENLFIRIDEIQPPQNLLENKLTPAIGMIQLASEEVMNRAKGDETTIKHLNKLIKNAISSGDQLENKLQTIANQSDRVNDVLSNFERINDQVGKSGLCFIEAAKQVTHFSEAQKDNQKQINHLLAELSKSTTSIFSECSVNIDKTAQSQRSTFNELEHSLSETLNTTKQHNDKLAIELNRSREYTEQVHNALVSLTDSLTNKISTENETYISNKLAGH